MRESPDEESRRDRIQQDRGAREAARLLHEAADRREEEGDAESAEELRGVAQIAENSVIFKK